MAGAAVVRSGLEGLCKQGFQAIRGLCVGLVTHPAAVDRELRHAVDLLREALVIRLAALFGPEHGLDGEAQDMIAVPNGRMEGWKDGRLEAFHPSNPPSFQPSVHSLYGDSFASLKPTAEQLEGLDALVIDLQDVGSRYYTFQATMLLCLEAASERNLLTVILDRPNPLGGLAVEGPTLQNGFESYVGIHPIAIRHGMTIGELARLYHTERKLKGELRIIPCEGWRREMYFDQTGLPWIMPSPNMPSIDTAIVYPGQCLLEGTNLSEGRGTTRPFELCGAPWLGGERLARRLGDEGLPGVAFRAVQFKPTFHKFKGEPCGGVQLHVTDRETFQPVRTGLAVLAAMRELSGERFDWRREPYEFVTDRLAIDLLFGSDRERLALEAGQPARRIADHWTTEEEAFRKRRREFLLY
jgi:uncharacterized protein YbbC (DUF1343 family)